MNKKALAQSILYNEQHRIGDNEPLQPGFRDGGRKLSFHEDGRLTGNPNREILVFKSPEEDPVLANAIAEIKAQTAHLSGHEAKARRLSQYVATILGAGDADNPEEVTNQTLDHMAGGDCRGHELSLGQIIEGGAGVCRHRSLLFKVMADALNIPATLVRGNFLERGNAHKHAWNEVQLEDGRSLLVDPSLGAVCDQNSPALKSYRSSQNEPLYDNGIHAHPARGAHPAHGINTFNVLNDSEFIHTTNGIYIDIENSDDNDRAFLRKALSANGITFGQKRSSLDGGKDVLTIDNAGFSRINDILKGKVRAAIIPHESPLQNMVKEPEAVKSPALKTPLIPNKALAHAENKPVPNAELIKHDRQEIRKISPGDLKASFPQRAPAAPEYQAPSTPKDEMIEPSAAPAKKGLLGWLKF